MIGVGKLLKTSLKETSTAIIAFPIILENLLRN